VAPPTSGLPADQSGAKWVQVRVYNNSTIKGLAAQAAADLRADGWNVVEAANYPYGIIPTTTAYFTPGTDEETAAKALATTFGMHAEPRFGGIQDASPGVIVIVTNDYQGLHPKGS
jgi:LytR cell envelope-related transcriptional attenuator